MELYFCDLCQEGVPRADIDSGSATLNGERVTCHTCNLAMGSKSSPESKPEETVVSIATEHVTPKVAAVLGLFAILLTLTAVVATFVKDELDGREQGRRFDDFQRKFEQVSDRQKGTREGMISAGREAGENAVYAELKRFDVFEQQLAELRETLSEGGVGIQGAEQDLEGFAPSTVRDPMFASGSSEKLAELEEQLLFLQARVFELQEAAARGGSRVEKREPKAKVLVPEGELGQLVAQLKHEDPIERVSALFALANVSDVGVIRHVTALLSDSDAYIRALAARVLERTKSRSATKSLIVALEDGDGTVRMAAVSALRAITGKQFRFDPQGPAGERFEGTKRWEAWWAANWKQFLYEGE
mgnify:CR=1 FL=1